MQITRTTPLRRMMRQFSQTRRTELRTFIVYVTLLSGRMSAYYIKKCAACARGSRKPPSIARHNQRKRNSKRQKQANIWAGDGLISSLFSHSGAHRPKFWCAPFVLLVRTKSCYGAHQNPTTTPPLASTVRTCSSRPADSSVRFPSRTRPFLVSPRPPRT